MEPEFDATFAFVLSDSDVAATAPGDLSGIHRIAGILRYGADPPGAVSDAGSDGASGPGHIIRGIQIPFPSGRIRLTIPIILARDMGPDAGVYTQCEPWTPKRVAALQTWIRDLREESDSDVIVASREPSETVAQLPEVAEFIHLPYDDLPPPES